MARAVCRNFPCCCLTDVLDRSYYVLCHGINVEDIKDRSVFKHNVVQSRRNFLGQELCSSLDVVGGFLPLADGVVTPRNL